LPHETKLKVKKRPVSGRLVEAVDEEAAASVADEVPQEDDTKAGRPAGPRFYGTIGDLRTQLNSPVIFSLLNFTILVVLRITDFVVVDKSSFSYHVINNCP